LLPALISLAKLKGKKLEKKNTKCKLGLNDGFGSFPFFFIFVVMDIKKFNSKGFFLSKSIGPLRPTSCGYFLFGGFLAHKTARRHPSGTCMWPEQ
jgi:hypothetical protein